MQGDLDTTRRRTQLTPGTTSEPHTTLARRGDDAAVRPLTRGQGDARLRALAALTSPSPRGGGARAAPSAESARRGRGGERHT